MKKLTTLLALGISGALILNFFEARAELEVSATVQIHAVGDFSTPLSSCGTWVEVGSYGRCWRPAGVVVGWRPYCDGYWIWTDCGWYWASDEPWAWACYHYGWWVDDDTYGWIWVPGVVWAPAWVSWRIGGGFCGWAPLPPPGFFFARRPADSAFVFVEAGHFGERIRPGMVVANNATILRQTRFISNDRRVTRDIDGLGPRKVIFNEGPGLAAMEHASGRQFKTISIRDANRHTPLPTGFRHAARPAENRDVAAPSAPSKSYAPPNGHSVPPDNYLPPANENGNDQPSHSPDRRSAGGAMDGRSRGQGQGAGKGHDHDY